MTHPAIARLQALAVAMHLGLATSVAMTLAMLEGTVWFRMALAAGGLLPLVFTFQGLLRLRMKVLSWLAVALVGYAGFGIVEVIATGTRVATAVLLCSLAETALLLMISRRLRPQ